MPTTKNLGYWEETIECISLMAWLLEKESVPVRCWADHEHAPKSQTDDGEQMDADDPKCHMISAWARMCKIIGPSLLPICPCDATTVTGSAQINQK